MSRDKWDRSACEREIANCELQIANFKFEEGEIGCLRAGRGAESSCNGGEIANLQLCSDQPNRRGSI